MTLEDRVALWLGKLVQPNQSFGGLAACPYAHTAHITIHECGCRQLEHKLAQYVVSGVPEKHVVIISVPIQSRGFIKRTLKCMDWMLRDANILAMMSNPDDPFIVDGFQTTQKRNLFVLLQNHRELLARRAALGHTDYYKKWTDEDIKRLPT